MRSSSRSKTEIQALIQRLDALCRNPAPLPQDNSGSGTAAPQAMILIQVRTHPFLAALGQVAEILDPPRVWTAVPGTKPWFLGIANHRGNLLPIYDLGSFMWGGPPAERSGGRRAGRLLVVKSDEPASGLIVSEVVGMRRVRPEDRLDAVPDTGSEPYIQASYPIDGAPVPVLDLDRLMDGPLFNDLLIRG